MPNPNLLRRATVGSPGHRVRPKPIVEGLEGESHPQRPRAVQVRVRAHDASCVASGIQPLAHLRSGTNARASSILRKSNNDCSLAGSKFTPRRKCSSMKKYPYSKARSCSVHKQIPFCRSTRVLASSAQRMICDATKNSGTAQPHTAQRVPYAPLIWERKSSLPYANERVGTNVPAGKIRVAVP